MTFRAYIRPMAAPARRLVWQLTRFLSPPRTHSTIDPVLVHLGCGAVNAPGYTNVDIKPLPHVHYVHGVYPLEMFESNSIALVYASHVLEHFPVKEVPHVLKEWRRVLKVGGILRLGVPNFEVLTRIYSDTGDIRHILGALLGGQTDQYNYHYSAYDERYLAEVLGSVGFKEIKLWNPDLVEHHEFQDTTGNVWRISDKDYAISLNIEAVK